MVCSIVKEKVRVENKTPFLKLPNKTAICLIIANFYVKKKPNLQIKMLERRNRQTEKLWAQIDQWAQNGL